MSKYDDADEFIKRSDAINEAICAVYWALNQHGNVSGQVIIDRFNAIPSADVQPVVHGEWKWRNGGECSKCGFHNDNFDYNFCPNCGADMRGGT